MILKLKKIVKRFFKYLAILLFFIFPMFWFIPKGLMTEDMSYIVYIIISSVAAIICMEISFRIEIRVLDNVEDLNKLENFFKLCDYETEKRNEDKK